MRPQILLLAILFLPIASAAIAPRQPPAVVGQIDGIQYYPSPPGSFTSNATINFILSPDDTDQVNGAFNYTLWINETTQVNGCSAYPSGWLPVYNIGHTAIPNRPGWVSIVDKPFIAGGPVCGAQKVFPFNLTAASAQGVSPPSCIVTLDASTNASHDQCGAPQIIAPTGMSAAVVNLPSNTTVSLQAMWPLSLNDTDQVNGSFRYHLTYFNNGIGATADNVTIAIAPFVPGSPSGFRIFNQTDTRLGSNLVGYRVYAEDNATLQYSNLSCFAGVNAQVFLQTAGCGSMGSYTFGLPSGFTSDPVFPMVNVPAFAQSSGLSMEFSGYFIGAFFLIVFGILGYVLAKGFGAVFALTLAFCMEVTMNLFPWWSLILAFTIFVSLIVVKFKGNATE